MAKPKSASAPRRAPAAVKPKEPKEPKEPKKPNKPAKPRAAGGAPAVSTDKTLIVVAPDGRFYKITNDQWEVDENLVQGAGGLGLLQQLTKFGTYLAYIPPDIAGQIGHICTLVNLQAITADQNKDG